MNPPLSHVDSLPREGVIASDHEHTTQNNGTPTSEPKKVKIQAFIDPQVLKQIQDLSLARGWTVSATIAHVLTGHFVERSSRPPRGVDATTLLAKRVCALLVYHFHNHAETRSLLAQNPSAQVALEKIATDNAEMRAAAMEFLRSVAHEAPSPEPSPEILGPNKHGCDYQI